MNKVTQDVGADMTENLQRSELHFVLCYIQCVQ